MRKEINFPKEARLSLLFFFTFNYVQAIYIILYTYLLKTKVTGGSVEQPLQDLDERAQNQPKPHPLSRIG